MTNSNCLEGARCPECGQDNAFHVVGTAVFTVHDDGTDEGRNIDWESDSSTYCAECDWSGTWGDLSSTKQTSVVSTRTDDG